MKIKPVYIINSVFIIIIVVLLFTPLRYVLEKYYSSSTQKSEISYLQDEHFNIQLTGINTANINFKDLKGKKIFLHFWATWCPACMEEMPDIQKLYTKEKNNMQFVFIYIKDDKSKVMDYLRENNFDIPVYDAVSPIDHSILPQLFPTTYLIEEDGKVKQKIEGARDWGDFIF